MVCAQRGTVFVFQQLQWQHMTNNDAEGRGAVESADPLHLAQCRGEAAAGSGGRDGLTPLNHNSASSPVHHHHLRVVLFIYFSVSAARTVVKPRRAGAVAFRRSGVLWSHLHDR